MTITFHLVKFNCSVCGRKLAVRQNGNESYSLLAMGFADQWLPVNRCPGCHLEYNQENLAWRYRVGKDDRAVDLPF